MCVDVAICKLMQARRRLNGGRRLREAGALIGCELLPEAEVEAKRTQLHDIVMATEPATAALAAGLSFYLAADYKEALFSDRTRSMLWLGSPLELSVLQAEADQLLIAEEDLSGRQTRGIAVR